MKLHLASTTSTMDDARSLIAKGVESPSVVYADYQRSGRGRIEGRRWMSDSGASLLATFIFKTDCIGFQLSSFPLFAGYVVATSLKGEYGIDCRVKWPNDVIVDGAKLCGIYTECIDSYISCGIGINLNQSDFVQYSRRKGCSIRSITGKTVDRDAVLEMLLRAFDKNLKKNGWIADFQSILYRRGEKIAVLEGLADSGVRLEGILEGIGEYGQMLIRLEDGSLRDVFTGEIL